MNLLEIYVVLVILALIAYRLWWLVTRFSRGAEAETGLVVLIHPSA